MAKSSKSKKDATETVEDAVIVDDVPEKADAVEDVQEGDNPDTADNDSTKINAQADETDGADYEDTSDQPEPADDVPDEVVTAPMAQKKSGAGASFLALVLGGALAAGAGFLGARYPDQWPFADASAVDPVVEQLETLSERVSGLETNADAQTTSLAQLQADDSVDRLKGALSDELAALQTQFDAASERLAELENRLHTVEKLPQGSGMEAAAAAATAYERELTQMRAMLDNELAKISAAQENAQTLEVSAAEAAKSAAARAAMSRVMAALSTGAPFDDALFDLAGNAGIDTPAALSAVAKDGASSLTQLQASFPDAARAALDASIRQAVSDGSMSRTTAFFRTQLGTRSLAPKEGDDADAILSRAEAALKEGRLEAVLTELSAMPEAGQPALANWIADVTARKEALSAAEAVAQQLNSN